MRNTARRVALSAIGVMLMMSGSIRSSSAQNLSIQSTSFTTGNFLSYAGLGDLGGGVGHGTYQLGSSCLFAAGRTSCTTTGAYAEVAGSANPGATGTYSWRMTWLGNIPNPVEAKSVSAGSNILSLLSVPPGAFFEVTLSNGSYANLDFGAQDTPNPTGGSLNWQAFFGQSSCTGSPATCSVGSVGLTNGATISGTMSAFNMQLTYPSSTVPEPSTLVLCAIGIAAVAARRVRRTS